MGLGDLDKVRTTSMQGWAFPDETNTPEFKTQDIYTINDVEGDVVVWIPEWSLWNGYYRTVPELKAPIDKKALLVAGMGYESPKKKELEKIRGNGVDIFDSIIMNMIVQYTVCGDGISEIIRDVRGRLINLKPLNPGEIRFVGNPGGIIRRYEQIANAEAGKDTIILQTWQPNEIFHLSWNRIANEIHGISTVEKLKAQIIKLNQAKDLMAVILRRHVIPVKIWEVDEDDPTKMKTFQEKVDNTYKFIENIIVPEGAAKATILQMQKGTIDEGINWMNFLEEEFIKAEGVPAVNLGSGVGASEATSKILTLNFQPTVTWNRTFVEKQLKAQVGIEVKFNEPPSIDPALLADSRKNSGDKVNDFKQKEVR